MRFNENNSIENISDEDIIPITDTSEDIDKKISMEQIRNFCNIYTDNITTFRTIVINEHLLTQQYVNNVWVTLDDKYYEV